MSKILETRIAKLENILDEERARRYSAEARVAKLENILDEERARRYSAEARVATLEKLVSQGEGEANKYRAQVRDLVIQCAELRGYIQRVYEVDKAAKEEVVEIAEPILSRKVPFPSVLTPRGAGGDGGDEETRNTIGRVRRL